MEKGKIKNMEKIRDSYPKETLIYWIIDNEIKKYETIESKR